MPASPCTRVATLPASISTAPGHRCWKSCPSPICAAPPRRSPTRASCTRSSSGSAFATATRLYDPDKNETRSMRTKEDAHDYRYFPDPDLLPLVVSADEIEKIRSAVPKLPKEKRQEYVAMGLEKQADSLISSRQTAEYFD